jgi:hypothetical protein
MRASADARPAGGTAKCALARFPASRTTTRQETASMTALELRFALALAAVLAPAAAAAQTPPIKPGLWEVRSERQVDGRKAPMPADSMKNLSPEVRAKIEAQMKANGVALGSGGANRICFDKSSLDAGRWQSRATTCKTEYSTRSATGWKWRSTCTQPESTSDGEAVFTNAENYTVSTTSTHSFRGEPKTTQMTIRAKWLGADCGDLKPIDPKR